MGSSDHAFERPTGLSNILAGGGELGSRVRELDWSQTDLGPIESWPQSLKTSLSLILNSQHPMWVGWGKQKVFFYNDAYIQILGSSKHPWALGRPLAEVWSEILDVVGPLADKVFDKGEATFVEGIRLFMRKPRDEGEGFYLKEEYYSFSYSPIRDESGEVGGLFCPSADVTGKVLSERRLRTLAELSVKALIEKTSEAASASVISTLHKNPDDIPFALLYLIDPRRNAPQLAGTTGLLSGERPEITPAQLSEVITRRTSMVISVKGLKGIPIGLADQAVEEAIVLPLVSLGQNQASGMLVIGINPARPLDPEYRTFFELISSHVATAIQNATAAEDEKKRLEAMAEIDRAKTTFFSNVSHEFRTPLTLMLGPMEDNLADPQELSPSQRHREELAYRNALRLLKLVNSLLDFSRIEAGRGKRLYQPTDLPKLTADLASNFRAATEKAGLKLIVETPELGQPVFIDREMWEKIVLNLLSNAFKFTLEGSIEVALAHVGDNAVLTVRDSGIGIPEAELPKLFERFHRVEGSRGRTHEGTGIGLALVQELVKLHAGKISVESRLGKGTTFRVEIPLGRAHLPAEFVQSDQAAPGHLTLGTAFVEEALRWLPDAPAKPGLAAIPKRNRREFRILLADDNADMRGYVKDLLETRWDVEAVTNGEEALHSALANPPDLILSDVMMPKLDGFGLIKQLKEHPQTRGISVVLLSARAGEESKIEGLRAGADDYLVKPFSAKELLARIQTQLETSRQKLEAERESQKLSSIFAQAPVGIALLEGPEYVFSITNSEYTRLLFGGPRDFRGKSVREAVPESVEQGFLELLDGVWRTGEPFVGNEHPITLRQPDGTMRSFFINFVYQPLRNPDRTVRGIFVIVQDVTEQVAARRKIEQAIASRDEFLSVASHELKTPLTSLKLQLQMTRRKLKPELGQTPAPEIIANVVDNSLKQANRLTDLVEDLLDVSRIQAGRLEFNFEKMNAGEMVREVVERFADQIEEAHSSFEVRIDPKIEATWDRSRMEQVVVNLLSNAIKYARGSAIHVEVAAHAGRAVIRVRDFGPGIPAERQPKIFERFERATSSRNISGLGLGLYIVKQIVQGHGGSIRVESAEGKGAEFIIELPLSHNPG